MRTLTALFALVLLSPLVGCGKREFKDFRQFTSPDGKYTALMPGTPYTEVRNEYGFQLTTHAVEVGGEGYAVSSADIPPGTPCDLSGAVTGLAQKVNGTATRSEGASHNSSGWREFEIEGQSPHKFYSGRVLFTRSRFYIVFAFGRGAKLSNQQVRTFLDSFRITDGGDTPGPSWTAPVQPPVQLGPARPAAPPAYRPNNQPSPPPAKDVILGHPFDPQFRDDAPAGGVLVGLDVWYGKFFNNDVVSAVRPIYRVAGVDSAGQTHGTETERGTRVLAKPGYAVGAVSVRAGLGIDALTVTFMKVSGGRLDPNDSYVTEQMGGPGGNGPTKLGGDGTLITGIIGRKGPGLDGFGLVYQGQK